MNYLTLKNLELGEYAIFHPVPPSNALSGNIPRIEVGLTLYDYFSGILEVKQLTIRHVLKLCTNIKKYESIPEYIAREEKINPLAVYASKQEAYIPPEDCCSQNTLRWHLEPTEFFLKGFLNFTALQNQLLAVSDVPEYLDSKIFQEVHKISKPIKRVKLHEMEVFQTKISKSFPNIHLI